MSPEQKRECYLAGVRLFNAGDFFDAHEAWEEAWRASDGRERTFYQGLIQCAVALEHGRRANPRGAAKMAARYPAKFRGLPAVFMGLDVARFLADMRDAIASVVDGGARRAGGPGSLDHECAPRIELLEDGAGGGITDEPGNDAD